MDALVEVHDEAEMRRALALGAPLIGINNRDLRDLIDRPRDDRAAGARWRRTASLVSESGIRSRADVERLAPHVDGFLVGIVADARRRSGRGGARAGLRPGQIVRPEPRRGFRAPRGQRPIAGFVFVPGSPAPRHGRARRRRWPDCSHAGHAAGRRVPRCAARASSPTSRRCSASHAVQLHGARGRGLRPRAARASCRATCEIWTAVERRPRAAGARRRRRPAAVRQWRRAAPGRTLRLDAGPAPSASLPRRIVAGGIGAAQCARGAAARRLCDRRRLGASTRGPACKSPEKIAALFEALRPPRRERLRACA